MIKKTEEEWKKILTPEKYHILRKKGTEKPFTGKLLKNKDSGTYICAACANPLFSSDVKFDLSHLYIISSALSPINFALFEFLQ